jgi:hypothetical protein
MYTECVPQQEIIFKIAISIAITTWVADISVRIEICKMGG